MEKINIAELLKDCPKDMELDCTSYDNVSFDKISDDKKATYPIFCYITDEEGSRSSISFTENGCESKRYGAKCVIFPKGKTTWKGFHRPFKDGDILSYQFSGLKNRSIYIYRYHPRMNTSYYVALCGDSSFTVGLKEGCALNGNNDTARFATEEEKEKLFQAIKDNGYKWNSETKTLEKLIIPKFKVGDAVRKIGDYISGVVVDFDKDYFYKIEYNSGCISYVNIHAQDDWELIPDKFDVTTLKPFDKVLARCSSLEKWRIQFFEKFDKTCKFPFICMGYNKYTQCIPYEGNEHLLDTADSCSDYYRI